MDTITQRDNQVKAEAEGNLLGRGKGTIKTLSREMILEALKKMEQLDSPCTCDATVMCSNAVEGASPVHMKKGDGEVHLANLAELNKTDIQLEENFSGCKKAESGLCNIAENYLDWILDQEWKEVDETSGQGEGKEKLSRENSYMFCTKYEGVIYFHDDGQAVLDNTDEILSEIAIDKYIEENEVYIEREGYESQVEFLNYVLRGAIAEELRMGVPWQVTLGQAAMETGWGKYRPIDIYTDEDSHNIFGIKYSGEPTDNPNSFVRSWTEEEINPNKLEEWRKKHERWTLGGEELKVTGRKENGNIIIKIVQPFKKFNTVHESIVEHSEILDGHYYEEAKKYEEEPYMYLYTIAPIYATDSNYYKAVASILDDYMNWRGKEEAKRP